MYKLILLPMIIVVFLSMLPMDSSGHRSGCHRWHSCPSDSGSYGCGDLGYDCRYSSTPSNTSSPVSGIEKESRGSNSLNDPNPLSTATSNATDEAMKEANKLIKAASDSASSATNATESAMNEARSVLNLTNNVSDTNPN